LSNDQVGRGPLIASWLGLIEYSAAWELQRTLFAARLEGLCEDTLLLLEHPPTYTLGRRAVEGDLVYDEAQRAAHGISLFDVDRGGRATYHGPGQLVGYPIMALGEQYDVIAYLRSLEEALIRTASDLGVTAQRDARHTGAWVGRNKLGAIGVKVTRGITMHGFALNVTTDLSMFEGIVPCGIGDRWVTSVEAQTNERRSTFGAAEFAAANLAAVLGRELVWTEPEGLIGLEAAPTDGEEQHLQLR
jgi:lipoyl(octanoyl) transferase